MLLDEVFCQLFLHMLELSSVIGILSHSLPTCLEDLLTQIEVVVDLLSNILLDPLLHLYLFLDKVSVFI